MATNDVWRLSFLGSHSGTEIAVVTMHLKFLTGVATFAGGCAYVKTNLIDLIKTKQASTFRWDQINGLLVNATPRQSDTYVTGFPVAGSDSALETPRQVALVVTHKTAYAGRSYRGRHYWPAMVAGNFATPSWGSTMVAAIQTYYDDLVAGIGSGGSNADYQWVVWSDLLNTATPVTAAIVRTNPAVIRRRRVGAGQ